MAKGEDGSLTLFDFAGSDRLDDDALLLGKPDYSLSTNDDLPAADHIATLSSIAIVFPVFSDGRGFTMRAVFSPHLALPAHCLLMAILSLIRQIICFVAALPMQW